MIISLEHAYKPHTNNPCVTASSVYASSLPLQCSLLLGWGLDAWVVYGSIYPPSVSKEDLLTGSERNEGTYNAHHHYWVVTLDALKFDAVSDDLDNKAAGVGVGVGVGVGAYPLRCACRN